MSKKGLPGSARPKGRLPVTPGGIVQMSKVARAAARRPSIFPIGPPTWPGTVNRPPVESRLGMNYDTEWARRPPARFGRALLQDLVAAPAVRLLASPEVRGLDRIQHLDEPVIFAANHASHLDAPLLVSVIPERWRSELFVAGAADYFFDTRFKATAFSLLLNAVPIERQRVSRASANRVASLLGDGWSMLIFPEGGRSPDGWARPHRAGAAWLAVRTGRPLVPVYVSGTRSILAKGSRRIRPGRTSVDFGRPLRPGEGVDPRELAAQLESEIAVLADQAASDWYGALRRASEGITPTLTGPDAPEWRRAWALGEGRRASKRRQWPN